MVVDFFILFIINIIFIEFISYFSIIIDELFYIENMYFFIFFIFFFINFVVLKKIEVFNVNLDILSRYYLYFFKKPNYLYNFLINTIKQIYIYYIYFKYRFNIDTNRMILRNFLSKFNLTWKPLFKRFSYFGYFRSNRSKWIK